MCGVFAVINPDRSRFVDADFDAATKVASHRGPDNMGTFTDEHVFLGHTRLSIIDISESANQPFFFEDLVLSYNGEIYNYVELREKLKTFGYRFSTESDTEVVLKAFHKWGGECFGKFNGMWALVIHNRATGTTVISRDRFGQKPLFMTKIGDSTYFASELQQLLRFWNGQVDFGLVQMFLKEGQYDGGGRTFFSSIESFPKAHFFTIDAAHGAELTRYWNYWSGKIEQTNEESFSEFEKLFEDAVKIRLRSDVPYGFLLSGGVDSTLVSAFAEKHVSPGSKVPGFTFSAHGPDDEKVYAQQVADMLNISLFIREQDTDGQQYRKRLRQIVRHLGRGHSSPAIVPVDQLYELAADHDVPVILDGQGADELLAGYETYTPLIIVLTIAKGHPLQAMKWIKRAYESGIAWSLVLFLRNILPQPLKKMMRWLYGYERFFTKYDDDRFTHSTLASNRVAKNRNIFNRYLIRQHDLGLENLLFYGDAIAMRHSIENRSPFMDYRLVDFALKKDESFKLWDGIDKYPLKRLTLFEKFASILNRKKLGFPSPIFDDTKLMMIEELKTSPILDWPIFNKRLLIFICNGGFASAKYERLLFRLYQVHLWEDIFISRNVRT